MIRSWTACCCGCIRRPRVGGVGRWRCVRRIWIEQCLIFLREKGGTVRWQPVSPTLMRQLVRHGEERGASRGGQLLRYRDGRVITSRRYDYLWVRVRARLAWADAQQVSTHWLRHTTLTWVDRNFGFSMAHAYAGHSEDSGKVPTTATYVKPTLQELCEVVTRLTGEAHPQGHCVVG